MDENFSDLGDGRTANLLVSDQPCYQLGQCATPYFFEDFHCSLIMTYGKLSFSVIILSLS